MNFFSSIQTDLKKEVIIGEGNQLFTSYLFTVLIFKCAIQKDDCITFLSRLH